MLCLSSILPSVLLKQTSQRPHWCVWEDSHRHQYSKQAQTRPVNQSEYQVLSNPQRTCHEARGQIS